MCGKMNHWKGSEFCDMKGKVRSVDQSPDCLPEPFNITQEMWNKVKVKALGTCKLPLEYPKTSQKYLVNFVVVGKKAAEKMNLITVYYYKIDSVSGVVEDKPEIFQKRLLQALERLVRNVCTLIPTQILPLFPILSNL